MPTRTSIKRLNPEEEVSVIKQQIKTLILWSKMGMNHDLIHAPDNALDESVIKQQIHTLIQWAKRDTA